MRFAVGQGVIAFEATLSRMGRIAKAIKIAHCRPMYHLTGVPGVPSAAAGEPAHRLVSSFEHIGYFFSSACRSRASGVFCAGRA
jgi:hypothetical protein